MKYIKTYESVSDGELPKVGDYIIVKISEPEYIGAYVNYVNNHIGEIIGLDFNDYNVLKYIYVRFPDEPFTYSQGFRFNSVIDWSPSKEKMEIALSANKYNL